MAITAAQREMAQTLLAEYCRTGDRQQLAVLDDLFSGAMGGLTKKEQDTLLSEAVEGAAQSMWVGPTSAVPWKRLHAFVVEYFIIWPRKLPAWLKRHGIASQGRERLIEEARARYQNGLKRWEPDRWRTKAVAQAIEWALADQLVTERADQRWQALWQQDFSDCTADEQAIEEGVEFYVCYIIQVHDEDNWLDGDLTPGDIEQQGLGEVLTSLDCIELPRNTAQFHQKRRETERGLMFDLAIEEVHDAIMNGNRAPVQTLPAVLDILNQVHAAVS